MILSMTGQLWLFTYSLLLGVMLAVLYDIGTILIHPVGASRNISDVIYWLVSSVLAFLALLRLCYGELRPYIIIALFIGMRIYFAFVSPVTHCIIALAAKAIRLVLSPALYILKPVLSFFKFFIKFADLEIKGLQNKGKCAIMYFVNLFIKHRGVSDERKGSYNKR